MTYTLDSNVFLRYLQKDNVRQAQRVSNFFHKAKKGIIHLRLETFVVMEVSYALSRYFKLPKNEICEKLRSILALAFIDIPGRDILAEAVGVYATYGVDFTDAVLFVFAQRANVKVLSFDSDFDKLIPKLRVEP